MGNNAEAAVAYSTFAVLFLVSFLGIVGRCLGWSDPSAPTLSKADLEKRAAARAALEYVELDEGDGTPAPNRRDSRNRVNGSEDIVFEKESLDEVKRCCRSLFSPTHAHRMPSNPNSNVRARRPLAD